jgi:tripartite-type tricarboxylate transporter receptor subunit TctC
MSRGFVLGGIRRRGAVTALVAAAACVGVPGVGSAQSKFPERPVTFVVPGPAGGGPDQVARLIGDGLATRLGAPVIVENKAGATGMIGAENVARAEPNGYRLLFTVTALVQAPAVFAKVPYNVDKDFVPLAQVANAPVVLVVRADSKITSVAEFIQAGKHSKPLSYGTFGVGSSYHIYGEALARSQHLNLLNVPYKGESLALQDLLGGALDATFVSVGTGTPQIRAGKVRALAIVSKSRSSLLSAVPTFEESGVAGMDAVGWFGVLAPAGTPAPIASKIAADIDAVVADPAVSTRLKDLGFEPVTGVTLASFGMVLRTEAAKWKGLIAAAGVKPE